MIIIPSNVTSIPSDVNWRDTTLMLKTIGTPGATNSAFYDDGPNRFVPTRVGDVTQGALSPYIPSGYWSNHFDGSGDYLSSPSNTTLNFATSDFTIEAWINLNSVSTTQAIVSGTAAGSIGFRVGKGFNVPGGLSLFKAATADNEYIEYTFVPGQWYHVAVVRQSGVIKYFVNGVQQTTLGSGYASYNVPAENNVRIGSSDNASETINGHLSNVRVTKAAVYTGSFTPTAAPLTALANTTLLACQNNRFRDNSSSNLTLTRNGDVSVSRFAPHGVQVPVTTNLASTGSVYLDGTGDWVTPGSNSQFAMGTGNFTAECWVMKTAWAPNYESIIDIRNSVGSTTGFVLGVGSSSTHIYHAGFQISGPALALGRWHHLAAVRVGTTITLYINGTSAGSYTTSANFTDQNLYLGTDPFNPGGEPFLGWISNARLVKGTAVYTGAFTPPTSPLTAITNTSLLTCQDAVTVTDASTNNFTVTRGGNAAASEVSPFKRATAQYGGSAYFDGTGDYLQIASAPALSFGTGDFTIDGWFLREDTATLRTLFSIGVYSNGVMFRTDLFDFMGTSVSPSSWLPPPGVWFHVAVTRSSSVLRVFIDGVIKYTSTNGTSHPQSSSTIGTSGHAPSTEGWKGYISNFRVVKGTAVYTGNFTPPTTPVTAISGTSLLLNFDNAGIYDATGAANYTTNGTAATTATAAQYSPTSIGQLTHNNNSNTASAGGALPVLALPADFTAEFWYRPIVAYGDTLLYDHGPTTAAGFSIWINSALKFGYLRGGSPAVAGTTTVTAGNWYHVAVCRSGSTVRLFVNGTQEATYTDSTVYPAANPRYGSYVNNTYSTAGYYGELRVTRAARYTANFTPPTTAFPTQ